MFLSFSFWILSCPDLSINFLSISLILLGPLTAQPNYNKFLIFHSFFAHTLSSSFTSLHVPSISPCASFSADQNYRPSWIRLCFCHCDGNAWYRLIMYEAVLVSTLGARGPEFKGLWTNWFRWETKDRKQALMNEPMRYSCSRNGLESTVCVNQAV